MEKMSRSRTGSCSFIVCRVRRSSFARADSVRARAQPRTLEKRRPQAQNKTAFSINPRPSSTPAPRHQPAEWRHPAKSHLRCTTHGRVH